MKYVVVKMDDPTDFVRATFIVDSQKLQLLKDYAYVNGREIKSVVNQMLDEFLSNHFDFRPTSEGGHYIDRGGVTRR